MNKKIYDDVILKKLQQIELEILKEFDLICEENSLQYFLCGGSAIGVIRHQGIIPWDDDIDVGMNRKDYDKFLEIALKEYSNRYTVVNNETNPNFPLMNTRWGLNGTQFVTEDLKEINGDFGIFLDIFCFDNIPDDDKSMKKQGTKAWFFGKLLVLSGVKTPVLYIDGWKKKLILGISRVIHNTFKLLHIKPSIFYNRAKKYAIQYENIETKRMAYMFDPQRFTSIVEKADVYPTKKMMFSGFEAQVPHKIEAYLKKRYGDFMTVPPVEKQHNHPPYILNLGNVNSKK